VLGLNARRDGEPASSSSRTTTTSASSHSRGLIRSDGCRAINRIKGAGKRYAYPRYTFTNHSADIRQIFCHYLDALDIAWRPMTWKHIPIARRDAVAKLDAFVGPKV
jgi:hypothetical protein